MKLQLHRSRLHRRRERGSALVMSSVLVMFAAGMGAAILQMQSGMAARQRELADKKRALYIAEAGLSEGFFAIAQGKSGNIGSADEPAAFGDGVFWVEAHEQSPNVIAMVSNGLCGTGRFSAAMVVERQVNAVASLGFFGNSQLSIGASAVVDGYESALGSFESQATNSPVGLTTGKGANINANASIAVSGPTTIIGRLGTYLSGVTTTVFGDCQPGPSGTVTVQPNVNITGKTSPLPKSKSLPSIEPPLVQSQGELSVANGSTTTLTGNQVGHSTVKINSGGTLKIKGPASVVVDDLLVSPQGTLELDGSTGPVLLHVKGFFRGESGSTLTSVGSDPKSTALVVHPSKPKDLNGDGIPDPPVVLSSSGTFYGVFYAPGAKVTIPASLRVFGSVAADDLTLAPNARVTFDQSLLTHSSVLAGIPAFLSWKITELPKVPIVESRLDPRAFLRKLGKVALTALEAHPERHLVIRYVSHVGAIQMYSGPASTFNWSNVKSVISKLWS